MPHRTFRDSRGEEWQAWDVHPSAAERRASERRKGARPSVDRRKRREVRVVLEPELRDGWLAFKSSHERRRLAPIPENWTELPDHALAALVQRAERLMKSRRLIE